jgi:hypothetical protein
MYDCRRCGRRGQGRGPYCRNCELEVVLHALIIVLRHDRGAFNEMSKCPRCDSCAMAASERMKSIDEQIARLEKEREANGSSGACMR